MEGSGRSLNYFENFLRFMGRFFPPDFSVMGAAGSALLETFRIAVMATFFCGSGFIGDGSCSSAEYFSSLAC